MKSKLSLMSLLLLSLMGATAFAGFNINQDIANAVAEDPDAIGLIKAIENSKHLECSAPGDEETAFNRRAETFSADYGCKESDDGSGAVILTVTVSGQYTFKSNGELVIRVNSLKINE